MKPQPNTSVALARTASEIGEAPYETVFRLEKSACSTPGVCSSALIITGARNTWFTRSSPKAFRTAGGENSACSTMRPPAAMPEKLMFVPATWNIGIRIRTVSSAS